MRNIKTQKKQKVNISKKSSKVLNAPQVFVSNLDRHVFGIRVTS